MADTKTLYTGNGTTKSFAISFPYINREHVKVHKNGVLMGIPGDYSFTGDSTIEFQIAPAVDDSIEIKRVTPGSDRLVNFQNAAVLTSADLNLDSKQAFFLLQETKENYDDLINAEILRIGSGNGIVSTDPNTVIANLVDTILNDETAADLQAALGDISANGQALINLDTLLDDEVTLRGAGDNNLQQQINALVSATVAEVYVQPSEPVAGVGGIPNPIPDGARWYDSDDNNHAYIWDGAVWQDLADPQVGVNAADITALDVRLTTAEGDILGNASALSVLDTTVTNLDGEVVANAAAITQLETDVAGNTASILSEQTARSDADTALATTLSLLGAQNAGQTAFVLDTATVKIDSDAGDTLATRFSALGSADSDNAAAVLSEQSARISADGALASDITSVQSQADGNSASITSQATSIDGLLARYGVSLDVNGYVTGFLQNNDGDTGEFLILADKFSVVDPAGGAGQSGTQVFTIEGGNVVMSGDLLAAGTVAASALQADMVISNLIRTSTSGVRLEIDGTGTYPLWYGSGVKNAANALFYLDSSGNAVFGGSLTAGSVTTTELASGAVTIETDNQSTNTTAGSAPYHESLDHNSTGGQVQVVAICFSAYTGTTVTGLLTATLQRSINDGSWSTVKSASITIPNDDWDTRYVADPLNGGGVMLSVTHTDTGVSHVANGSARFEYIDTTPADGDKVEYRVRLSGASASSYSNQNWISTKEWKR